MLHEIRKIGTERLIEVESAELLSDIRESVYSAKWGSPGSLGNIPMPDNMRYICHGR